MQSTYSPDAFIRSLASLILRHHGVEAVHVLPLSASTTSNTAPITATTTGTSAVSLLCHSALSGSISTEQHELSVYVQVLFTLHGWRHDARVNHCQATKNCTHAKDGVLARYVVEGSVQSICTRWCAELQRVLGIVALLTSVPPDMAVQRDTRAAEPSGSLATQSANHASASDSEYCDDTENEDENDDTKSGAGLRHTHVGNEDVVIDTFTRSRDTNPSLSELVIALPALSLDKLCWRRDMDGLMGTHFYTVIRRTIRFSAARHDVSQKRTAEQECRMHAGPTFMSCVPCGNTRTYKYNEPTASKSGDNSNTKSIHNYHGNNNSTTIGMYSCRDRSAEHEPSRIARVERPWAIRVGALLNADIAGNAVDSAMGDRGSSSSSSKRDDMALLVLFACSAQLLTRSTAAAFFDEYSHGTHCARRSDIFNFMKCFTTRLVLPCLSLDVIGVQLDQQAHSSSTACESVNHIHTFGVSACNNSNGNPCKSGDRHCTMCVGQAPQTDVPIDEDACHLGSICVSYRCLRRASIDVAQSTHNIVLVLDTPASLWLELYDEHGRDSGSDVLARCRTRACETGGSGARVASMRSVARQLADAVNATLLQLVVHNVDIFGFDSGRRQRAEVSPRHAPTVCIAASSSSSAATPITQQGQDSSLPCDSDIKTNRNSTTGSNSNTYPIDVLIASIAQSLSSIISRSPNTAFVSESERLLSLHAIDDAASSTPGSNRVAQSVRTASVKYSAADLESAIAQKLRAATMMPIGKSKRKKRQRTKSKVRIVE